MKFFGFLNCHKPPGMTSRDLVNLGTGAIRKSYRERLAVVVSDTDGSPEQSDAPTPRLKPPKVGHAGTLDPLAEGVLVMGVGPAAKLTSYLQLASKQYQAHFVLGQRSESGDLEQPVQIIDDAPVPTLGELQSAARQLTGRIRQVPPSHSAIKINGRRAYKMARKGVDVPMPARAVDIHELTIQRYEYPNVWLDICCGSGTYIRTLGMDLARQCGTESVMHHLVRTRVGQFELADAMSVQQIREGRCMSLIRPANEGLSHLTTIHLDDEQTWRITNGLSLHVSRTRTTAAGDKEIRDAAAIDPSGDVCAIAQRRSDHWRPTRVFHKRLFTL
ncbi:tRNA pseudouridine(55) synthase TruB [Crateriforma conspicua]|uniref:tRNA pseudouridine(55) synthase TruB n=1 Tax=Crateriforma conspicua TaxID=2527996 RepID=UPI00118AC3AD|nr:tRNA pseudouridine(55) synthase TruB [Crateriforma conspicua]QDV63802.1 tRNA pseudouridine synthase B [Crateriforma conspicua]